MKDFEVLARRNRLMVEIMWAISILFITFCSISGVDKKSLFFIAPALLIISLIFTFLVIKQVLKDKLMYLISLGLSLIHFLFVFFFHDLNGFLIGLTVLIIISLYQYYKTIILTGAFVILTLIYGYFTGGEKMYGTFNDPLGLAIVSFIFIIVIVLMCIQSRFTEKVRIDVVLQKEKSEKSRARVENILNNLRLSITNLNTFSTNLINNVNTAGQISEEITSAFNEIAANIDSQTTIIANINSEVNNENNDIVNIVKESNSMQSLAKQNLSSTNDIENYSDKLSDEMNKVQENVKDTVTLMDSLKAEAENISSILETVNTISEQINMLALNAAIEAARAGEHGRGFAVVADEVRKLADQSKQSNSQIYSILNDISGKIQQASNQVHIIQTAADTSNGTVEEMTIRSRVINENSSTIESKSNDINSITIKTQDTSSKILSSMRKISEFTTETSTSVEQVLSGAQEQNTRIDDIVLSFESLENLIIELKKLVDSK
jgi:methyl-accepting chemotaxis protein